MIKFKPKHSYNFNENDYAFINELIKVGFVHILSSQVNFISEEKWFSVQDLSEKIDGFKMPDNWNIQYISCRDEKINITFGVEKIIIPKCGDK